MLNILFLTTSNLATNPRLLKEVQAASLKYRTSILCFQLGNWSDALDAQLLSTIPNVTINYIPGHRKKFLPWLLTTVAHKVAVKLWPLFTKNAFLAAIASNKRSLQLYCHLLLHKKKYAASDFLVAHNLGALYPAQQLSRWLDVPFTFDVEDYHPGERIVHDTRQEKTRRELLMQSLLPKARFVTAASPLISAEVETLAGVKVQYISNSFYSSEFAFADPSAQEEVKFVWFSQNISHGRGLELLLTALDKIAFKFSLTLIGNLYEAFAKEWIAGRAYIKVLPPMEQAALHKQLATYDIGLALEISEVDLNKQLALSNKIFAYLQAGLFVVATDTRAQEQLLQQLPGHGLISQQTEEDMRKSVIFVLDHLARIREEKEKRFENAFSLAYEREEKLLLSLWDGLVSKAHHEESNHSNPTFSPL